MRKRRVSLQSSSEFKCGPSNPLGAWYLAAHRTLIRHESRAENDRVPGRCRCCARNSLDPLERIRLADHEWLRRTNAPA